MSATFIAGEEPTDLAEPAFDAPPAFRDADERRIHVRAYNHWAALLRGRAFPAVADFDPAVPDFAPNGVLLTLAAGDIAPGLRYVGERLRAEAGLAVKEASLADVPPGSLLARLIERCSVVLERHAPVGFEAEFVSLRGLRTLYRGILMPLSDNGRTVDAVYGVINWKEVANVDLAAGLVAEMVEAMAAPARRAGPSVDPFAVPPAA